MIKKIESELGYSIIVLTKNLYVNEKLVKPEKIMYNFQQ